jgi:hypothetical protein
MDFRIATIITFLFTFVMAGTVSAQTLGTSTVDTAFNSASGQDVIPAEQRPMTKLQLSFEDNINVLATEGATGTGSTSTKIPNGDMKKKANAKSAINRAYFEKLTPVEQQAVIDQGTEITEPVPVDL